MINEIERYVARVIFKSREHSYTSLQNHAGELEDLLNHEGYLGNYNNIRK